MSSNQRRGSDDIGSLLGVRSTARRYWTTAIAKCVAAVVAASGAWLLSAPFPSCSWAPASMTCAAAKSG